MERAKMPRIKRAAQFAPFDALKGLHDALKQKEIEHANNQKQQTIKEYPYDTQLEDTKTPQNKSITSKTHKSERNNKKIPRC